MIDLKALIILIVRKDFISFGLLMINEFSKKFYQERIDFVSSMLKVVI